MASLDEILNFAIPTLLVLVAFGFVYTKFLQPWVFPMLVKFWEWVKGSTPDITLKQKEISYE